MQVVHLLLKKSHDIALYGVTSMNCLKVIFTCSDEESVDTTAEHMHSITERD